jgi:putative ABC transport system permease protein
VIGVLASKGQAAMGNDQDDIVVVPLAHAAAPRHRQPADRHAARVDGRRHGSHALKEGLRQLLRERRKLAAATTTTSTSSTRSSSPRRCPARPR